MDFFRKIINNLSWWLFIVGLVVILLAGASWLTDTGSTNVVDMYGCVLPKYFKDRVQIENIMRMRGYTDEQIDFSFNCQ